MRNYRTRGTPWTIIIGTDGKVTFNAFRIRPDDAIQRINKLLEGVKKTTPPKKVEGTGS